MPLIRGDARALPLADRSVDCIVTSPPYWGLRDYRAAGQIGLEPTPAAYVASIVAVFRELARVLTPTGTAWLNLGDSYATGGGSVGECPGGGKQGESWRLRGVMTPPNRMPIPGLKPKDLAGIPWRVAFALQADGWYLRSDIIWHKPNPMPESVTDRPTKAHEYLFLLTRAARYYYDTGAIAEPYAESTLHEAGSDYRGLGLKDYAAAGVQNPSDTKRRIIAGITKRRTVRPGIDINGGWQGNGAITFAGDGRNKRSVWTIPTMPYAGAHFATMPEALVEPCILAGCPLGGRVLDPFVGSGTVVAVAERLGRRGIGVDLTYQDLARARTAQRGLTFAAEHPAVMEA